MIGNFLRVGREELDSYLEDSSLLENRVYNEEIGEDPCLLDIDKAWDGIIYLLTGKGSMKTDYSDKNGLHGIIFSGQIIDEDQDLGYGPAHYLTPPQVSGINDILSKESRDSLFSRFNPSGLTAQEVYPVIWDEGNEAFEYLYIHFVELQNFYSQAAKENQAIITFIN
jgi:hypothetical protein